MLYYLLFYCISFFLEYFDFVRSVPYLYPFVNLEIKCTLLRSNDLSGIGIIGWAGFFQVIELPTPRYGVVMFNGPN